RAGVTFGPALVYATAGVIGADLGTHVYQNVGYGLNTGTPGFSAGGIFGGGLEYAVMGNWSVKAEYLHFELPGERVSGPYGGGAGTQPFNIKNSDNIVRLGINFR